MTYASEQSVLNGQWNAAEAAFLSATAAGRPHVLMRPKLFPDGTMWCALYGENLAEGVAGFGSTPAEAMTNFDMAWTTAQTPAAMLAATGED